MSRWRHVQIEWDTDLFRQEVELRDRLLRQPLGLRLTESEISAESKQLHFGTLDGDRLIASVVMVPQEEGTIKLRQMVVETAYQNRKVGSGLVRFVENQMTIAGYNGIKLNARVSVIGFYAGLGYEPRGEEFTEVGIPHQRMWKSLS